MAINISNNSILIVINQLGCGGTELQLSKILPDLLNKNLNIFILSFRGIGEIGDFLNISGIKVYSPPMSSLPFISSIVTVFSLISLIRSERPAIIHFYLPEAYMIGGIVSLFFPHIKRVMSRRSLSVYKQNKYFVGWLEKKLHQRMKAVLANSDAIAGELIEEGVNDDQLFIIKNGIDCSGYSTRNSVTLRNTFNATDETLIITYVANLIPYKGHSDLIRALHTINDKLQSDWIVLFAGRETEYGSKLRSLAAELGLVNRIHWLGQRDDISTLLSSSDIGVCPSHQEGFSNFVLEGMAAGLPMIVTNVGGNPEAVIDGVTGKIVPKGSPKELGIAILELANNSIRRHEMGEAGKTRVREEFSLDKIINAYEVLYKALLSNNMPVTNPDRTINVN